MFPGKKAISVFGDKMPITGPEWEDVPLLMERLPDFHIVAIVRAPDQVIRSSLVRREAARHGIDSWPIRTVQEAMRQWLTAWRVVIDLRERYGVKVLVVKYEDLCADMTTQLGYITAWLGLPPHQVTMEVSSLDRAVTVHSAEEQEEIRFLTEPLVEAWCDKTVEELIDSFGTYSPPYILGEVVRLKEETASSYLEKGFSFREEWGRWTDGEHATVKILHGLQRGLLLFEMHVVQAYQRDGRTCDVIVNSGWGEPKLFSLPPGSSRIAFVVRAEEAEQRGVCSIELVIPAPKHPDAPPADSRVLGILVESMRLSKVPMST